MDEDKASKTLELAISMMNSRDVDSVLRMIVDNVTDNFGYEACDAFILDEERDNFVIAGVHHSGPRQRREDRRAHVPAQG
ncbi:MAG: hypothetical protein MUC90_07070 [Thermoplasmata archaeon]|nr:hypothetical protein [Thermoplasmata archaeon]